MPGSDGAEVLPDALQGAAEDEDVVEDGQKDQDLVEDAVQPLGDEDRDGQRVAQDADEGQDDLHMRG